MAWVLGPFLAFPGARGASDLTSMCLSFLIGKSSRTLLVFLDFVRIKYCTQEFIYIYLVHLQIRLHVGALEQCLAQSDQ